MEERRGRLQVVRTVRLEPRAHSRVCDGALFSQPHMVEAWQRHQTTCLLRRSSSSRSVETFPTTSTPYCLPSLGSIPFPILPDFAVSLVSYRSIFAPSGRDRLRLPHSQETATRILLEALVAARCIKACMGMALSTGCSEALGTVHPDLDQNRLTPILHHHHHRWDQSRRWHE